MNRRLSSKHRHNWSHRAGSEKILELDLTDGSAPL
jgi:hypothetical protein